MVERDDDAPDDPRLLAALELVARGPLTPVPHQLGAYVRGRLIGRGGMGAVYEATDAKLQRTIALKVTALHGDPERRERALREARLAASVQHPNLAHVYDVGEAHGFAYVAMQLVDGAPLAAAHLTRPQARRCARAVLSAVAAAHAARVVHRDLKPSNVMLTKALDVKVLDFGLALLGGAAGERAGTDGFTAPEQAAGAVADARADVYSVGRLFEAMGLGADPLFRPVIARCVAHDPAHRPRDAGDVLATLDAVRTRRARRAALIASVLLVALAAAVSLVPRAPRLEVMGRARVFSSSSAPYRGVAAGPNGRFVAAQATRLEWVDAQGESTTERWSHGRLLDVAWGTGDAAWALAIADGEPEVWRIAPGRPAERLAQGPFVHLKASHDGAYAIASSPAGLSRISASGEQGALVSAAGIGDFDVAEDGRLAWVALRPEALPDAELWHADADGANARRAGAARLGLEGGRSGFAWPRAALWLTARLDRDGHTVSVVASKAGTVEPSVDLGALPSAAVSSLDARGDTLFFLQTMLQSDVYLGQLDGGALDVARLTDTANNERVTGFIDGDVLGMTDGVGGWSLARWPIDGGATLRAAPHAGLTWPQAAADGGLWAFALEPVKEGVRPVLLKLPDRRVRELPALQGASVPPAPRDTRVRCQARGCALARLAAGRLTVEGLDYPLSFDAPTDADSAMGVSMSPSGRWLAAPGLIADLDQGERHALAAKGCVVHAVAVDDDGSVIAAEECSGDGRLSLYPSGAVLYESPFVVTSPERDGARVAFIVKHERCEAWTWQLAD